LKRLDEDLLVAVLQEEGRDLTSSTVFTVRIDKRVWTGPALSRLIVYAVDVAHLVLATEPVGEYERSALFKERARVSVEDGEYLVELPRKVYDFYRLVEADYTVMASQIKPKTIEILL
jgi:hypothetical protein